MKGLKEEIEEKEEEDKNDTAGSRARKEETNLKMNEKEHFLAWHRLHIKRRPLPYRSSSLSNTQQPRASAWPPAKLAAGVLHGGRAHSQLTLLGQCTR